MVICALYPFHGRISFPALDPHEPSEALSRRRVCAEIAVFGAYCAPAEDIYRMGGGIFEYLAPALLAFEEQEPEQHGDLRAIPNALQGFQQFLYFLLLNNYRHNHKPELLFRDEIERRCIKLLPEKRTSIFAKRDHGVHDSPHPRY